MPSNALPMAPAAFQQWCRACALAPSTCDYLSTIRGSQPVRCVTSRGNSVSGAYPSRKMGVTIQFESQNPELWTIVMMDRDESVLEFFEQPDTFKIRYLDKSGKKMQGHYYTPDFLVLRNDSVCFEEWKRDSDLKRLATLYPFRYQQQEDGSWRCPPAEEAVSALGLTFRVRSSAELHPTYIDNLLFLEDYFDMTLSVPVPVQTTILQRLRETPGLPLYALASDGSGVRANDIYAMLALDLIYTDLYAAPLIQHGRVCLYLNAEQARTSAHLLPTRLTSRVGSPLPEVSAPLAVNTQLLWDGRAFTEIEPESPCPLGRGMNGSPSFPPVPFSALLERGCETTPLGRSPRSPSARVAGSSHDQEEWFYVLEGEFLFEVGAECFRLHPGDSLLAPRQVPHVWAFVREGRGRILVAFFPAGNIEAFFREVTRANAMPPQDPGLWRVHGMELLGPPLSVQ